MSRQAKIVLSADVTALKQAIQQAKKDVQGLGSVKIDDRATKAMRDAIEKDLSKAAEHCKEKIVEIKDELASMETQGINKTADAFVKANKELEEYNENLKETEKLLDKMKKGGSLPTASGGGGGGGSPTGTFMKGAGRFAAMLGIGLSINHFRNVANEVSKQRVGVRSLTGGSDVGEDSAMGFTPEERRQRAQSIARAVGRNMSSEEITNLTNFGEKAERAFGVEQGTLDSAMGAASRAGVSNQEKFLMSAMGTAVANGLEGSKISDYLSAMTGMMDELSDSITVSPESINAFAGAFGDIPFFKNDPSRLFSQMRGVDGAFKGGDRFQQAQAARAILASNRGASPAEIELRRELGLFGNSDALVKRFGGMEGGQDLAKTLGVGGTNIMNSMFGEARGKTGGMKMGERVNSIMRRLGLQGEGGMMVAADIIEGKKVGTDAITKARMSPEEQLKMKMQEKANSSFAGAEKNIIEMNVALKKIEEKISMNIGTILGQIYEVLKLIAEELGVSGTDIAANTATVAGAAYLANKATTMATGKGLMDVAGAAGSYVMANPMAVAKVGGAAAGLMYSPEIGRGSDTAISDANSFDVMKQMRDSGMPVPDSLARANVPFRLGFNATEQNAARGFNPANVTAEVPGAMELPEVLKTTDSEAVAYLRVIAEAMTGRGASAIQNRRVGGVPQIANQSVGKRR